MAAGLTAIMASGAAMAGKDHAIKARGSLNCGVGIGTAGFMLADSQGKWRGFRSMSAVRWQRRSSETPAR
jgi:general L-amino acid transport system substrate-binding protein